MPAIEDIEEFSASLLWKKSKKPLGKQDENFAFLGYVPNLELTILLE
jgi:hypothetical protein